MRYFKKIVLIICLLVLVLSALYAVEAYYQVVSIENKVVRLHILANSDMKQDQELKLKVRNSILSEFNSKFSNLTTSEDAEATIIYNLERIREIAQNTVYDQGYYYKVKVYYGNYLFPERTYGDFTLPKGDYNAVRVVIGQGKGQNWWCVMFPPICFLDFGKTSQDVVFEADVEKQLETILSKDEIDLIKTNRGYYNIRFKSKLAEIVINLIEAFR